MKNNSVITFIFLLFSFCANANSPYENRLMLLDKQRVGLIAFAQPDQVSAIKALVATSNKVALSNGATSTNSIVNLSLYVRDLNDKAVVFAYFETPNKSIAGWEKRLSESSELMSKLNHKLKPHSRAPHGEKWLRMEWINHIASDTAFPYEGKKIQKMGLMSGLKPETELTYRQLHQLNWPGVVDGMVNSNYRNWTTFLVEVGESLYLFTYTEYIGTDIKEDNRLMGLDPTTQRWWQHTEPCLINLHGEGNWSSMTQLKVQ
jgi:L-rhamnose mutarotase